MEPLGCCCCTDTAFGFKLHTTHRGGNDARVQVHPQRPTCGVKETPTAAVTWGHSAAPWAVSTRAKLSRNRPERTARSPPRSAPPPLTSGPQAAGVVRAFNQGQGKADKKVCGVKPWKKKPLEILGIYRLWLGSSPSPEPSR